MLIDFPDEILLSILSKLSQKDLLQNLTYLTFGDDFNQPVDYLPPNLSHLTFGWYFNQPVDHLPQKIKEFGIWK
jgi:hypothetical protein